MQVMATLAATLTAYHMRSVTATNRTDDANAVILRLTQRTAVFDWLIMMRSRERSYNCG